MCEMTQSPQQMLQTVENRLQTVLQSGHLCYLEWNLAQRCCTCLEHTEEIFGASNSQMLQLAGINPEEPPQQRWFQALDYFIHPEDREVTAAAVQEVAVGRCTSFQARLRTAEGTWPWCKIILSPLPASGTPTHAAAVILNIQNFRDRAEKLAEEARIDSFTGLYHKICFEKMAEAVLQNHPDQRHALILFDLDNFEEINNTYGKLIGDAILRSVAGNLRRLFGKPHLIGRYGGDEFVVLMQNLTDDAQLHQKLELLLHNDDNALKVTKSVGVSVYPDDAEKFSDLLHLADLALYHSKEQKNTTSFYGPEQNG